MLKILFVLCTFITLTGISGVFDYTVKDIHNNEVSLADFRGKKILIVNTASASPFVSQYESLERLYQLYKDSLVIIAFPSNSFGHEPGDSAAIEDFLKTRYQVHFMVAQKTNVSGEEAEPLYTWLTQSQKNQVMNCNITGDFYKFLIDGSGRLIGAFAPSVDPMSSAIQSAVTN